MYCNLQLAKPDIHVADPTYFSINTTIFKILPGNLQVKLILVTTRAMLTFMSFRRILTASSHIL